MNTILIIVTFLSSTALMAGTNFLHCNANSITDGNISNSNVRYCSELLDKQQVGKYREFQINKNWILFAKTNLLDIEWKLISYGDIFITQNLKLQNDSEFSIKTKEFFLICKLNTQSCENTSFHKSISNFNQITEKPFFDKNIMSR